MAAGRLRGAHVALISVLPGPQEAPDRAVKSIAKAARLRGLPTAGRGLPARALLAVRGYGPGGKNSLPPHLRKRDQGASQPNHISL